MLAPTFEGTEPDLAEENLQARIRGTILMTMSNKFGWLVLTTGNKSEMATGYSTLYGDMAGGFAVIKDVPKMLVYELCARPQRPRGPGGDPRDGAREATVAPSCDRIRRTTDSLPAYEVLDPIIEGYVEDDLSIAELEAAGHDSDTVRRVVAPRRPQRVQAAAGAARRARVAPRRSARTAGCPSPTAGPVSPPPGRGPWA